MNINIEQQLGRAFRPDKEKHLEILADAYMACLKYHGQWTIGGDPDVDVMGVLGLDKNNAVERKYVDKLLSVDLCPYLRAKWARMKDLVAL